MDPGRWIFLKAGTARAENWVIAVARLSSLQKDVCLVVVADYYELFAMPAAAAVALSSSALFTAARQSAHFPWNGSGGVLQGSVDAVENAAGSRCECIERRRGEQRANGTPREGDVGAGGLSLYGSHIRDKISHQREEALGAQAAKPGRRSDHNGTESYIGSPMEPGFKGKGQGDMTRAVSGPHQINKTACNNTSEVNEAVYQHVLIR
jgi:hypothetical protein